MWLLLWLKTASPDSSFASFDSETAHQKNEARGSFLDFLNTRVELGSKNGRGGRPTRPRLADDELLGPNDEARTTGCPSRQLRD